MKIAATATVLVLLGLLLWISSGQEEAMKQCEQAYSHDVCFQLLNR